MNRKKKHFTTSTNVSNDNEEMYRQPKPSCVQAVKEDCTFLVRKGPKHGLKDIDVGLFSIHDEKLRLPSVQSVPHFFKRLGLRLGNNGQSLMYRLLCDEFHSDSSTMTSATKKKFHFSPSGKQQDN